MAAVSTALVLTASQAMAFVNVTSFDRRSLTANGWDLDGKSFDYVIVGGGTAGLVLANRLSADGSNSVAVIEAGNSGYDDNDKFTTPDATLYDSSVNTQYDWQYKTTSQKNMNGRRASWPRGKVLGGSSAINGLYYVRHSRVEQEVWADLAGGNANDHWNWDNMLSHMKKSEHNKSPLKSVRDQAHIQYNPDSHGHNGPVDTTWPAVMYRPIGAFMEAANSVASPYTSDAYGGENHGTYMANSAINKDNWHRSFSRNAYLDPVLDRGNLHVLTGHQVTEIMFDQSNRDNVEATGVHYSSGKGQDVHTVHANKEVILCGGAINSPALLQLSGIGDAGHLQSLGIDVVVDLPGVGENLQDHLSAGMSFSAKHSQDRGPTSVTGNARKDSYVNSAVSYVSMDSLFNNKDSIISQIQDRANSIVNNHNVADSVKKGQRKAYKAIANRIYTSNVSPVEILGNVMFGSISIQAALQHPLSRGSVRINSKNAFDYPTINPHYLAEDLDLKILREGFKLARLISQQSPLKELIGQENVPGDKVQSNSEWEDWIRRSAGTEYHPSSTCAMMPRGDGGVVGTDLKVHGTRNLRVVDASVTPLAMSTHLMAVVYGIAEIAAEIILGN